MKNPDEIEPWRERLIEVIERDGRKPKRLSLDAGLNETFVRDLVDRGTTPTIEKLERLCTELEIDVPFLFAKEHKSSEDIAMAMSRSAIGRAFQKAMELPVEQQRLMLESMYGAFAMFESPRGQPAPPNPKRLTYRKKRAG